MNKSKFDLKITISIMAACIINMNLSGQNITSERKTESFRPQIHYTPKNFWMNDPNGMVYHNGIYHLFYQYSPGSTTFGPIHWGHATTKDLINWQEEQIALSPDSLGYIFSGSAVVDRKNSSGLAKNGRIPLVAFYTNHQPVSEKEKSLTYETQSIAYSLTDGKSWIKYDNNPVISNPGLKNFRDPKVIWYPEQKKWIMSLAVTDHVELYSSKNLINWVKESEFGRDKGAHGGVWECPDLFPLTFEGKTKWILLVSINPGGPVGGSATQYFIGNFDGKIFTSEGNAQWLDHGSDNYAGVTWSNTGKRKIFLAWMSNWNYAIHVPTLNWRGAMTIPREMGLIHFNKQYYLTSLPVKELNQHLQKQKINISPKTRNQVLKMPVTDAPFKLDVTADCNADFSIRFENTAGEYVIAGYNKLLNQFYVDRSHAGKSDFYKGFAKKHFAARILKNSKSNITLLIDQSSIELFADDGMTSITDIYFPSTLLNIISLKNESQNPFRNVKVGILKKRNYRNQ